MSEDELCKRCKGTGVVEIPELDFPLFIRTGLIRYGKLKVACIACKDKKEKEVKDV